MSSLVHTIVWCDQSKSLNSELSKICANIHFVQNVKKKYFHLILLISENQMHPILRNEH